MVNSSLFMLAATSCTKGGIGIPDLYDGLCKTGSSVEFTKLADIWIVIANIIRILVALGGALAVIFIIVSGLFYITSTGDPGRIKRAKDILKESITGLIIMLVAYSAITFIASKF